MMPFRKRPYVGQQKKPSVPIQIETKDCDISRGTTLIHAARHALDGYGRKAALYPPEDNG